MWLERTELVLGETRLRRLANARVAVIGLGGVGGAAAEALVRAGVGHMLFIDGDTVDDTNRNRQLLATTETVGMDKISAAEGRYRAINPDGDFTFKKEFYLPETVHGSTTGSPITLLTPLIPLPRSWTLQSSARPAKSA